MRAGGQRVEFATLCGHHLHVEPLTFVNHSGGRREATSVRLTARSRDWELEWVHAVRSSAVNGGGTGLGLVVYEQLSMHNLTLTKRADGSASPFAQLVEVPGFTEWSNPA